jgi:hydrogenase/urease accessory protein HupE
MLRAALTTLLIGCAVALLLTALHLVAGTPEALIARWWPLVLVAAGAAGLQRGRGPHLAGRWWPLAVLVGGLVLLGVRLVSAPVRELVLAAALLWLGLLVAVGGRLHWPRRWD